MYLNVAAYQFAPLNDLPGRRAQFRDLCDQLELKGSILLSREGINCFVAGERDSIDRLLGEIRKIDGFADIEVKESFSVEKPFNRMLVKIKEEIIAFGVDGVDPLAYTSPRITAKELKAWFQQGREFTMLDVRNRYEVNLGTFDGAVALEIDHFRDFPDAVSDQSQSSAMAAVDKDRPVVTFCTGGIRCEKAAPLLEQAGFTNVLQLDGGILKYFEECGGEHYDGECFVFDQRVALDSQLRETETTQCYACQLPLTAEEQQSDKYVPGKSCPNCFVAPEQAAEIALQARNQKIREIATPLPGSQSYINKRPIHIPQHANGMQLIEYLRSNFGFVPPDAWIERFERELLVLDDEPVAIDHVVAAGERYEHWFPDTVEPDVNPDIQVLHEDEALVVVNKPAPLPMHPCGRFNRNSLSYLLGEAYRPQQLRLAHRLDANTSGVVVFSRKREVAGIVQEQFAACSVSKYYVCRVIGHPEEDEFESNRAISSRLMRAGARGVSQDGDPGLEALTRFRVLSRESDGTSLVAATPVTGRTNQIRIHLWHLGWPIKGDPMYVEGHGINARQTLTVADPPLCLHAHKLKFAHPVTNQMVEYVAPLPDWSTLETSGV